MTREQKVEFKKARAAKRRQKRADQFRKIIDMKNWDNISFRQARSRVRGNYSAFVCEMRYGDCEERGYCNGDC
jgi:hypothetical protein